MTQSSPSEQDPGQRAQQRLLGPGMRTRASMLLIGAVLGGGATHVAHERFGNNTTSTPDQVNPAYESLVTENNALEKELAERKAALDKLRQDGIARGQIIE